MADEDAVLDVSDSGFEFFHFIFQKQHNGIDDVQDGQRDFGFGQSVTRFVLQFSALEQTPQRTILHRTNGVCSVSDHVHHVCRFVGGVCEKDGIHSSEVESGIRIPSAQSRLAFCRSWIADGLLQQNGFGNVACTCR